MERKSLRILVNDRPGHPFEVQLSRSLAKRGYNVQHCYGEFFQSPRGNLQKIASDPTNLEIIGIKLSKPFAKYSFFKRIFQEIKYSHLLIKQIKAFKPDVVIFANTPSEAMFLIYWRFRFSHPRFVFWVQDLYGIAINKILSKRLPLFGRYIGHGYIRLDRFLLKHSRQIVIITEDFQPLLEKWNVGSKKIHTIPNWATLSDLPVGQKNNEWANTHKIANKFCFLYSGTLGMKHNPELLLELAIQYQNHDEIKVIIISEGLGADWLAEKKLRLNLSNLLLLPYQPFEQLANVLASADVLVAILEPDAGIFSVPSKVLSYLCAQRPLLLAVPKENLAAKIVAHQKAGLTVDPEKTEDFIEAANTLQQDSNLRLQMGRNGRIYAETHFDIEKITDRFEKVIKQAANIP